MEEPAPLSSASLSFETIREIAKDSFFNASQIIGALEIDDEQDMWRSTSFNSHVAFRFSEILSVERGEETIYNTVGKSTGKFTSGSVGISHNNISGSSSRGSIVQSSASFTKSEHVQIVTVYTAIPKYRNITLVASRPAEAQVIKKTLEERMPSKNSTSNEMQQESNIQLQSDSQPMQISIADEIRKYKSLLDEGILSEDEFAAKKKQLLNM